MNRRPSASVLVAPAVLAPTFCLAPIAAEARQAGKMGQGANG
jgi:hypothetical protein